MNVKAPSQTNHVIKDQPLKDDKLAVKENFASCNKTTTKNTLKAVGKVVLATVYNYNNRTL